MGSRCQLSVIVPIYQEEESVRLLYDKIVCACEALRASFEMVFVDDGSRDATFPILEQLHRQDKRVRVIRFRKNYGQTAAMAAGFRAARGQIVVSMDGDLQNDPSDIASLLAKLDEGYDVVCGWRKDRKDKMISRRIPSIVANWIIAKITGVPIHDNGCSLKAYRASVIKGLTLYAEMHRFIPAMSTLTGASITEIIVSHHPRRFGKSKYGLGRISRVILDIITVKMITGFVSRPALWFGLMSLPFFLIGLSALVVAAALYWVQFNEQWLVTSLVGLLCLFLGTHLLFTGVVGELFVQTGDFFPKESLRSTLMAL